LPTEAILEQLIADFLDRAILAFTRRNVRLSHPMVGELNCPNRAASLKHEDQRKDSAHAGRTTTPARSGRDDFGRIDGHGEEAS
jgi:hypothetical protein